MDHTVHAESNWFCIKEFHQQEDFEALILTRFCFGTIMEFSPLSNGPKKTASHIYYTYFFSHQGQNRVHVYLDSVSLEFPFLPFCRRCRVFFFLKKRGRSKLLVRYSDVRDVLPWIRLKVFFSVKKITGVASASNIKKHFNYKN